MTAKRYKWDDWFALRKFILRRGEQYSCSQSSMAQQIRNAASNRNLRVKITDQEHQLVIEVEGSSSATTTE